jgi:predicted Zn-dependent protease
VARASSGARSKTGWVNRIIATVFVSSVTACVSIGGVHPTLGDTGKSREESLLLQQSQAQEQAIEEQGLLYDDGELAHYLTRLARSLQPPEARKGMAFRVKVIKDSSANAFSFPDGGLYLTTGMLARLENEAQLAIVLGHEMTHCTNKDALRTLKYSKPELFAKGSLREPGQGGQVPGALQWDTAVPTTIEAYLEELEMEADRGGFQLVLQAGYDPAEGVKLIERQQRDLGEEEVGETTRSGLHRHLEKREKNWQNLLDHLAHTESRGATNRVIYLTQVQQVMLENALLDERGGRFSLAQREVENYLAVRPNDERAYYILGEIYRERGLANDKKKARDCYAKALSIRPSFAEPYRGIGLLWYKEGEKRQAKSSFQAYLAYAPEALDRAYVETYLSRCN